MQLKILVLVLEQQELVVLERMDLVVLVLSSSHMIVDKYLKT
tara:strand:+ start:1485 stop:1610 length:126 start_codon:yes stop_codon:yes gene_type:complete